jgi:hypothetical protein
MTKLEIALLKECRGITENTLWNTPKPKGLHEMFDQEERETLAQEYFRECKKALVFVAAGETHRDPKVVLRAVRYLACHAIPPMQDSTDWFREGLSVLLVLACPYFGVPKGGEPFFEDIRRGMEEAESWTGDE